MKLTVFFVDKEKGDLVSIEEDTTYLESQRGLCDEFGVDLDKVKELHLKMAPLIRNIREKRRIVIKLNEAYKNLNGNLEYWKEIWSISSSKVTPKQKSLLRLFMYLELSEGVFDEIVQMIAFILMENHHDLYDPNDMKFLKDYERLEKLSLYVKLQFLELHGFEFVSNAFDRDLRNCIAHLGFRVEEDGSIFIRKNGKKVEDLIQKTDYLGVLCSQVIVIINKVLSEDPKIHFEKRETRF